MDRDNEIELVQTIQEKDKRIKELEKKVETLKINLALYEDKNKKLKRIVETLPNGIEILQSL